MVSREGSRRVRAAQGLRKLGFDLISLRPNIGMDVGEIGSCNTAEMRPMAKIQRIPL